MPASDPLIYKVYSVNDSFIDVFESLLIDTVYKQYKVDKIIHEFQLTPDTTPDTFKIDYCDGKGFVKPEYLYVKIYIESKNASLLSGFGWLYRIYLADNEKIYVFWEFSINHQLEQFENKAIEYGNISSLRRNKLEKINNNDIFEYK